MTGNIIERIRSADNLPSLPKVAVEVLRLLQEDDVSVPALAKVIQQDPALTGRILRVANSSLFGMPRKIASVQQAMVALGLRTVKVMVLGFSLVDTMRRGTGTQFDFAGFWRRSLTTAVACRLLGEKVRKATSDEAFITGLLCDLGIVAAVECAHDAYAPVIERQASAHEPPEAAERAMLGMTHEMLSSDLLTHWGLPQPLCAAVSSHHAPPDEGVANDGSDPQLTRVIRAAAGIAGVFCSDEEPTALEVLSQQILRALPIQGEQLTEVLSALDRHVQETASLFSVDIGTTRRHEDIQSEAKAQLAKLSMASELERTEISRREQAARRQAEHLISQNTRLAQEASSDSLTRIANRAAFDRRLAQECDKATGRNALIGLLLLDVDNFKKLNDTFGHQTGDDALRAIGAALQELSSESVHPARYGGEEFAIILSAPTGEQQARSLAENIRLKISATKIPYGIRMISISASVGGVVISRADPQLSPAKLIKRADECLYAAKKAGRNRVIVGQPSPAPAAATV